VKEYRSEEIRQVERVLGSGESREVKRVEK
jgi:hypothetical protein